MENPDQPVCDPRYEDSGPPHTNVSCEELADELCNRMDGFGYGYRAKTAWRILVERMAEYYGSNPDEFYQDYKEVHG